MDFQKKLNLAISQNNSLLCLGLDSERGKLPLFLLGQKNPQFVFNQAIIQATADLVCAYKINPAFYEAEGLEGIFQLKQTFDWLRENYPQIPLIFDGKKGDIGNSNEGYAKFAFDFLRADALTVHPYLGKESLQPFFKRKDKGIFVLCRTSNPGAGELQDLRLIFSSEKSQPKKNKGEEKETQPLYQIVAEKVAREWNKDGNFGLVVGATYPSEIKIVRHIVGEDLFLLIPGIGQQGGQIKEAVLAGVNRECSGILLNVSRQLIFASKEKNFFQKTREIAKEIRQEINFWRQKGRKI